MEPKRIGSNCNRLSQWLETLRIASFQQAKPRITLRTTITIFLLDCNNLKLLNLHFISLKLVFLHFIKSLLSKILFHLHSIILVMYLIWLTLFLMLETQTTIHFKLLDLAQQSLRPYPPAFHFSKTDRISNNSFGDKTHSNSKIQSLFRME